jgi:hypothetical protein
VFAELDSLALAFNQMLMQIQRHMNRQKQAEDEIRRLNESLEEKVSHRTQALQAANTDLMSALEQLHLYQTQVLEREQLSALARIQQQTVAIAQTYAQAYRATLDDIDGEISQIAGQGGSSGTLDASRSRLDYLRQTADAFDHRIEVLGWLGRYQNQLSTETLNVRELVETLSHNMLDEFQAHFRHVEIEPGDPLYVNALPAALSQSILHMLLFSLEYEGEQDVIRIQLKDTADSVLVHYHDPAIADTATALEYVYTRHLNDYESQDTPIAARRLLIARYSVNRVLHGSFSAEHSPHGGIQFKIQLPKSA